MKKKLIGLSLAAVFALSLTSCQFKMGELPGGSASDVIPDHVHNRVEETTEATCSAPGKVVTKCSECGTILSEKTTAKLQHTKGAIVKENVVNPTCTQKGSYDEVTYCTVCKQESSRKTIETDALGHDYVTEEGYVAPTCETDGYSTGGECSRCHEKMVVGTIPALGHDYEAQFDYTLLSLGMLSPEADHEKLQYTCANCHETVVGGVMVAPSQQWELQQLCYNPMYVSHATAYAEMWQNFYAACVNVLRSDADYEIKEYSSTLKECPIAEYDFSTSGMTPEEAGAVLFSFISSNPQFYFLKSTYILLGPPGNPNKINLIMDKSCIKGEVRKEIEAGIVNFSSKFMKSIDGLTLSQKELAKRIHDYICENLVYEEDEHGIPSEEHFAHSIIGSMDGKDTTGGVCECYAKSYLYLSYMTGLHSILVVGVANTNGIIGGHAWNYTEIGGKWYGVDVTWDDQDKLGEIRYDYFLCSKDIIDAKHYAGVNSFATYNPSIQNSEEGYFQVYLPTLATTGL